MPRQSIKKPALMRASLTAVGALAAAAAVGMIIASVLMLSESRPKELLQNPFGEPRIVQ